MQGDFNTCTDEICHEAMRLKLQDPSNRGVPTKALHLILFSFSERGLSNLSKLQVAPPLNTSRKHRVEL